MGIKDCTFCNVMHNCNLDTPVEVYTEKGLKLVGRLKLEVAKNVSIVSNLSLLIPGTSPAIKAINAIRYIWWAMDSGPLIPWLIHPFLFVVYHQGRGYISFREVTNRFKQGFYNSIYNRYDQIFNRTLHYKDLSKVSVNINKKPHFLSFVLNFKHSYILHFLTFVLNFGPKGLPVLSR